MTCIFCKIIKDEIPSVKLYENDHVIAIQALGQVRPGHSLIIPKKHSTTLLDIKPEEAKAIQEAIGRVGKAMQTGLPCQGLNITTNVGAAAGQEIQHTHIHLIPRTTDDQLSMWPLQETSEEERTLYAEKIIKEL